MTQDFDKLISSAAPEVPDCGESRRSAREFTRERVRRKIRQTRTRNVRGMSVAAGLVFLVITSGWVPQLGSDSFDVEYKSLGLDNNESLTLAVSKTRGNVGNTLSGISHEDNLEIQQQRILREGTPIEIHAFAVEGDLPWWRLKCRMEINGTSHIDGRDPKGLSVENGKPRRELLPFLLSHATEFKELVNSGKIEGEYWANITADGIEFEVWRWTRKYVEYGTVNFYRGYPVN